MIIVSGGQTGADIAGLKAAKFCGIETWGWMPKGFKTLDGPKPEYKELYNCRETTNTKYSYRTEMNVINTDCTILFAKHFSSPGTKLTRKLCNMYDKPCLDIRILKEKDITKAINHFIKKYNSITVNIAGNSEKTYPGIEKLVYSSLITYLFCCVQR